jgi:hypothetical protein
VSRPQNRKDPAVGKLPAANPDDPQSGSPTANPVPVGNWKLIGIAVFVLAAVWYVVLISLAALTGNPVTLNRLQLRRSTLVVSGTVDEKGVVSHIQVFKGIAPEGEIVVSPFPWPPGDYILPLTKSDAGRLEVIPSELPGNPPLIYPANGESIEQLRQILK